MSEYPSSVKSFTDIVDGVDYMEAASVNVGYDEIESLQTFIGATGDVQSYSASVLEALSDYMRGCRLEYKGAADIYVRSGAVVFAGGSKVRLRVNSSDLTLDWGDIDTGSEANSTLYYVYLVFDANATTFTAVISTNATTPTGATYYKRIGSFYNNASGDIDADRITNDCDVDYDTKVRGFISFNGSGTIAVNKSFNVAAITDNGTGNYTITFKVPFADTNYIVVGMSGNLSVNITNGTRNTIRAKAVGSCQVLIANVDGLYDAPEIMLLFLGEQ
ncbi:MAG: hypothetical protein M0P69_04450 [Bacteroidales bacterium]|nr:hypothetical protein [Bacteroidales bacterium]